MKYEPRIKKTSELGRINLGKLFLQAAIELSYMQEKPQANGRPSSCCPAIVTALASFIPDHVWICTVRDYMLDILYDEYQHVGEALNIWSNSCVGPLGLHVDPDADARLIALLLLSEKYSDRDVFVQLREDNMKLFDTGSDDPFKPLQGHVVSGRTCDLHYTENSHNVQAVLLGRNFDWGGQGFFHREPNRAVQHLEYKYLVMENDVYGGATLIPKVKGRLFYTDTKPEGMDYVPPSEILCLSKVLQSDED